jgi:hypothetical protein
VSETVIPQAPDLSARDMIKGSARKCRAEWPNWYLARSVNLAPVIFVQVAYRCGMAGAFFI